ncbi:glycosyltransferase family 2 protein [Paenibacillus sp. USDA918EY]|uniref:glycosyltransferase family 2 protein n=1 Tax=Paenibacillus sp. USDA918EY TaxID=2689575 RepID=UPI00135AA1B9|nr:glycosyltransferase family 2 protein [Paenibacillus sp. USDA918EY]
MDNISISVCMITKNEENYIGKAISSVRPFVEEIIVVDHNSTDLTPYLAKEAGAIVFRQPWKDDFAAARNFSITKANHPYILIMDADETLDSDLESLHAACRQMRDHPGTAARFEIQNVTNDGSVITWATRLFPNLPEFRYQGRIHEQLLAGGGTIPTWDTPIKLKHYGYLSDQIQSKQKIERNLKLLMSELESNPIDPYINFQVARTYEQNRQWELASYYYHNAVERINGTVFPHYHSTLLLHLLKCLIYLKNWDLFLEIIHYALEIYPDYTDLYYIYGTAVIESQNVEWFPAIPQIFESCLSLGEADGRKYETTKGVGSYLAHYNLGLYFEITGTISKAIYHYSQSKELVYDSAGVRLNTLIQ